MNVSFRSRGIGLLITNLLLYRIFTQIPMSLIKSVNTAAPLVTLFGGAVWIFIIYLISLCLSLRAKGNILDAVQSAFGTVGRLIVSVVFVIYLLLSQIFVLSDFSKLVSLIAFPASPVWYVSGLLILGGIIGAMGNIRSQARLHSFFMPVILTIFLLLVITTILPLGNTDTTANAPQNLSFSPQNILSQITLYGDVFILFLIAPTDESRRHIPKAIGISGIAALVLNTLFVLAFTLKIPASIAQNGQFPIYLLMKAVYFGRFFQRLDAVILLISTLSSMLYLSLSLNLLTSVLHQGFRLPQSRVTPVISGIAVFILALNEWLFTNGSLSDLLYIFSIGGFAILIITAIFVKIRGLINEKY